MLTLHSVCLRLSGAFHFLRSTPMLRVVASLSLLVVSVVPLCQAADPTIQTGETIYRKGVLMSGEALEGKRDDGATSVGADAACINCHQRSGLGSKEGRISIPPITGRYLFHARASSVENLDLPYVEGIRPNREPYTDESLAKAIREGIDSEGKPLNYLMPRYQLNDADMAALIGHLKHLDQRRLPGVDDTVLHFATIITPDADPIKAKGMLDVIEHYFAVKNTFPIGATPPVRSSRKMMYMVNRHWQLHIWRLNGPATGWQMQLEKHLAQEPVLAVVSGIGGANWAPVHAFCEKSTIPCLFPNVEAPPAEADRDFYSLYFSKGVLLEAGLIANNLLKQHDENMVTQVRQVYRAGDGGEEGAMALAALLEPHGFKFQAHALAKELPASSVANALNETKSENVLVLWLRPSDISALSQVPDVPSTVFVSGLLGGLEHAPLTPDWRKRIQLTYPFDLPKHRRVGVDFARGWFSISHIPVVDEQVQADTYLACGLLAETLSHMTDTFVREYLIERMQSMIEHRIVTGYYPHLALASGQRFASKGGYIVRFASGEGKDVIKPSEWIRP
jgi:hypothetical protein